MPRRDPVTTPDGVRHPSKAAAARHLGVDVSTIRDHLDRYGDLGRVNTWTVRCKAPDLEAPSISEFARRKGVTRNVVYSHLEKFGSLERVGQRTWKRHNRGQRTVIGPMSWDSRAAMARDLGVAESTISRYLSKRATVRQREKIVALVMQAACRKESRA